MRPSAFAVEALSGALTPGWEVELYRDRQLLGWTPLDAQGNYRLQVPTRYGNNPIEVVAYGPHGEVRRLERTFDVAAERLAEGMLEYALSGGTCPFLPCEGPGHADLRWGARRWATVRAGAYAFWGDSIPDLLHPYLATALQPSPALAVLADLVVNARASLEVLFAPMPSFQAGLRHAEYVGDTLQPILRPALEQRRPDGFVFVRPGGLWAPLFGQLDFSNFGRSRDLVIAGVPIGLSLQPPDQSHATSAGNQQSHSRNVLPDDVDARLQRSGMTVGSASLDDVAARLQHSGMTDDLGSIMIVLATDAPLDARQLQRVCARAGPGLARLGSHYGHGSGDFVVAFSTANQIEHDRVDLTATRAVLANEPKVIDGLFRAVVESVEEAIVNSLFGAETVVGRDDHVAWALPVDEVLRLIQRR